MRMGRPHRRIRTLPIVNHRRGIQLLPACLFRHQQAVAHLPGRHPSRIGLQGHALHQQGLGLPVLGNAADA